MYSYGHITFCLYSMQYYIAFATFHSLYSEDSAGPEYSSVNNGGQVSAATVSFWVQFKELVVTYKALCGIEPDYLRDHLSPIVSFWSIHLAELTYSKSLDFSNDIYWDPRSALSV